MNMQKLLQQAQQMQQKMENAQDELSDKVFSGEAGGGVITVNINGDGDIQSINFDDEDVLDDAEMLEDLIISAFDNAKQKLDEKRDEVMPDMPGGGGGLSDILG